MRGLVRNQVSGLLICLAVAASVAAQTEPHIGYAYPAGGQRGSDFEITVGGQYLTGANGVHVSGTGIKADIVSHTKSLSQKQFNDLRQKLQEVQRRFQAQRGKAVKIRSGQKFKTLAQLAAEAGVSSEDFDKFMEQRKAMADPKRQANPQLDERVTLRIQVAADAAIGARDLRLLTPTGVSNPVAFHVGAHAEYRETEPNDEVADRGTEETLPIVINGQCLPGDVDRFAIQARQGQRLVMAAMARDLIPYLADAVPGWFQASLTLRDEQGQELAHVDDYRFHPDPVLTFEVPRDGRYEVEIKDALYRGREDFVYRLTVGSLPLVTSVFPLGGRAGQDTEVEINGWNLTADRAVLPTATKRATEIGAIILSDGVDTPVKVPLAIDTLPERRDSEPNDGVETAQRVQLPLIVNGRIDQPGDWDTFQFDGQGGDKLVFEVMARRLNSPLDSILALSDASGRRLAVNDDYEHKAAGLATHHADSRIVYSLPTDGTYFLRLGDAQHQGGPAYTYRLRISPPRPDFALRVVPSSINARGGTNVPLTVFVLPSDEFSADIRLALKDAPAGFTLSGAIIPEGVDQVRLTLAVPASTPDQPLRLQMEGHALISSTERRRLAVPAEDMMQAFIYRHLVPANEWLVFVRESGRRSPLKLSSQEPVQLPAGGSATVRLAVPRGPLVNQTQLVLNDPPEGITIRRVSPSDVGIAIELAADADKVSPGQQGNLILEAFVERSFGKQPNNKRRFSAGFLPAIPFAVIESPRP